jgi:S-adenosylmethionine synthetase
MSCSDFVRDRGCQAGSVMYYGTGKMRDQGLTEIVKQNFDLRPLKIIERLSLDKPIYRETSKNGHFGHSHFAWEQP